MFLVDVLELLLGDVAEVHDDGLLVGGRSLLGRMLFVEVSLLEKIGLLDGGGLDWLLYLRSRIIELIWFLRTAYFLNRFQEYWFGILFYQIRSSLIWFLWNFFALSYFIEPLLAKWGLTHDALAAKRQFLWNLELRFLLLYMRGAVLWNHLLICLLDRILNFVIQPLKWIVRRLLFYINFFQLFPFWRLPFKSKLWTFILTN